MFLEFNFISYMFNKFQILKFQSDPVFCSSLEEIVQIWTFGRWIWKTWEKLSCVFNYYSHQTLGPLSESEVRFGISHSVLDLQGTGFVDFRLPGHPPYVPKFTIGRWGYEIFSKIFLFIYPMQNRTLITNIQSILVDRSP